jgi:tetratricopeptide (TPR) repeat protein
VNVKLGRNDRCSCGSGKKYKNCCGGQNRGYGISAGPQVEIVPEGPSNRARANDMAPADVSRLVAMANAGRYADMEIKARELIAAYPQSGFAWKALSVSLEMQRKDALQALETAARLLPNDVEAHNNLGTAWRRIGRLDDAVASYRRALAIKSDVAEVHNNLGNTLKDLGRFGEAVSAFRRALDLKPDFAKPYNNLGNALQDLGQLEDAVASYRRALALKPDYTEALNNLGISLRLQSRSAEAEMSCRDALDIDPNFPGALVLLAELHSDRGQFAEAEKLFRRAIAMEPESPEAWAGIAGLRRMTSDDAGWLAEVQRIAARSLTPRQELHLRFAMGKYFDDVRDFDRAFRNYQRANELAKTLRAAHDPREVGRGFELIMHSYGKDRVSNACDDASTSERPVFIVGMPRSGTTLAEQILASHPEVFGAGELPYWNSAASAYTASRSSDDGLNGVPDEPNLRALADEYLKRLDELSPDALRVVDKMPGNFLYLGLIHRALPGARIIHMRRNPIDTCLSIYFQNFGPVHSYANDLKDLAHYYGEYLRLMEHWRLNLPPNAILDVPYEGLVEDQEGWSRKMVEFIGLPWDPACLEFHQTPRTVSTFSKWQARQKISGSSVERWRNYEKFVGPLQSLAG